MQNYSLLYKTKNTELLPGNLKTIHSLYSRILLVSNWQEKGRIKQQQTKSLAYGDSPVQSIFLNQ